MIEVRAYELGPDPLRDMVEAIDAADLGLVIGTNTAAARSQNDGVLATASAMATSSGKPIQLPSGTIYIGSTWTGLRNDTTIFGAGKGITILRKVGGGSALATQDVTGATRTYRCHVSDILLMGDDTGTGLDAGGCTDCVFRNIRVDDFDIGCRVGNTAYYNTFDSCIFRTCATTGLVVENNSNQNRFIGCRINDVTYGIRIADGATGGATSNSFIGCSVENASTTAIEVRSATAANATTSNFFFGLRLETSSTTTNGIDIGSGVRSTYVDEFFLGGTFTNPITDAGTFTDIKWRGRSISGVKVPVLNDTATPSTGAQFYYNSSAAMVFLRNFADSNYATMRLLQLQVGGATPRTILSGAGSPEGAVTASVSSLYLRNDGGAGTSLYVKESGTGNTGWVAK